MNPTAIHPTPDQLRAFALGQLPRAELDPIARHVASCADCAAALSTVPEDTLLGKLRDHATLGSWDTVDGLTEGVPPELADHPRYAIVRRLGAGGMGTVYQARHRVMERDVALKVIAPRLTRHPVAVQRFAQEVKAAARLTHPNIVAAHDADSAGGLHFLVMEYVEGVSLDRLVAKKGPLPVEQAVHFIRQAALGLQHAHEQGMVHRDIKPHNLMVTRKGIVKILDFGLARIAQEATEGRPLTDLGTVLGTPDYIAPEQVADSHDVDVRADIYALGCTLYFLLAGRPPFDGGSAIEKALAHVERPAVPIREVRPDVPEAVAAALARMMAKRPADRFATPGDAAAALVERPATKRPDRRRWLAVAAGVACAALGVLWMTAPPTKKARVLVVLPHQQFWYPDYAGLRDALDGRAEIVIASSARGPARAATGETVTPALTLTEANVDDYAAVVFSGGLQLEYAHQGARRQEARAVIERALAKGRIVGGLCGGAAVVANAGILDGKRATGFPKVRELMERAGAVYVDEPVVVTGRVITGRDDSAARAFGERLLRELGR